MENKIICFLLLLFLIFLCFSSQCATVQGTLSVASDPASARVYLDGQYRGSTPLVLHDVSPGNHTLELRLDRFENWTTNGSMDDGGFVEIHATLVPDSDPQGH